MPFCPNCGREYQPYANFCNACGHALPDAPVTTTDAGPSELPYHISLKRIVLMTVLTWGLYLYYWFYLTWKQYRDHTGDEAYPVWHVLTLYVPIYGLFRTYAHARTYRDLMQDAGIPSSIKGWLAVVMMYFWGWLLAAFSLAAAALTGTFGFMVGTYTFVICGTIIALFISSFLHLQNNFNRYWRGLPNMRVTSARIGVGEVIFGIIGALFWLLILLNIFSPQINGFQPTPAV